MKITGGFLKGRNLYCPSTTASEIRPLRTRIRKALFDILGDDLSGIRVLDLFAGTGALGIEALSRGAEFVLFVDASKKSIELIKKNLERFNLLDKAMVLQITLPQGLKKLKESFPSHVRFHDSKASPEKPLPFRRNVKAEAREVMVGDQGEKREALDEKENLQGSQKIWMFDLVFITPPYRTGLSLKTLENLPTEILNPKALIVVEEESGVNLPDEVSQFQVEEKRAYGETSLYFYRIKA